MPRTVEVPDGCRVVFVSNQFIERMATTEDGWSEPARVQVKVPPADGLVVEPQFRYVTETS